LINRLVTLPRDTPRLKCSRSKIVASVVIGYSLGEYAALNATGVLSVSDTINLVGQRAKVLEKCVERLHAMLAVKGTLSSIYQAAQGKPFEVACINGKQDIVLCGTVGQIVSLSETLKQAGLKCMKLDVPYPFHSSQVEPIFELFNKVAHGATFYAPKVPVISLLLGTVVTEAGTFSVECLCRHVRESVSILGAFKKLRVPKSSTTRPYGSNLAFTQSVTK
jgi:acyl transferase domain-containing protein